MKSPNKSCVLDIMVTWRLKKCIAQIVPLITIVVNKTMTESVMASSLKQVTIMVLLKRSRLENSKKIIDLYRTFLFYSKRIEKVVARHMKYIFNRNYLVENAY